MGEGNYVLYLLSYLPVNWSGGRDSNPRQRDHESK